jgi:hypothetical protein
MNFVDESKIDHDQNFKELLHQLFEPFLRLFFPEHAVRLDFSKMTFLEQEYFTDFPKGKHRYIDTLVEVNTLSGKPQLILVHMEFQAKRSRNFPRHMFRYFSQLRLQRDTPIFPVVLYLSSGAGGLGWEEYREKLFGEEYLHFRYHCIGLPELQASVSRFHFQIEIETKKEYLATKNPVAYGLAPLMEHDELSKPELKAICITGIVTSSMNEVQAALLIHFLDTYLLLDKTEEEQFQQLIQRGEVEAMRFITSWERKKQREILLRQLRVKFGDVPPAIEQRVMTIDEAEELDKLLEQVIRAESIEKMGLASDA